MFIAVDTSSMAFTLERHGTILTLLVTEPKVEGMPRGLAAVQRALAEGGITEVQVGFDERPGTRSGCGTASPRSRPR